MTWKSANCSVQGPAKLIHPLMEILKKGENQDNNEIKTGVNVINGKVVNENVSKAFGVEYHNINSLI